MGEFYEKKNNDLPGGCLCILAAIAIVGICILVSMNSKYVKVDIEEQAVVVHYHEPFSYTVGYLDETGETLVYDLPYPVILQKSFKDHTYFVCKGSHNDQGDISPGSGCIIFLHTMSIIKDSGWDHDWQACAENHVDVIKHDIIK